MRIRIRSFGKSLPFLLMLVYLHPLVMHAQTSSNKTLNATKKTITGKITDETGKPLPQITITEKDGQALGTTNSGGFYSVTAAANATLIFSHVGYASKNISVENQSVLNVSLAATAKEIEDVVVVGYGTQKKRDITGAVSSFDTKDLQEKPISLVDQALIGQMPGLSILVRGSGSISAAPVVNPFANISPIKLFFTIT